MHMISSAPSSRVPAPLTPPNSSPPSNPSSSATPASEHPSSNNLKMTNFSIAAIMNKKDSSEFRPEKQRLGMLHSPPFYSNHPSIAHSSVEIKSEIEEDVDVEQCSDGETKEEPPIKEHRQQPPPPSRGSGEKKKRKDEKTKIMKPKCNAPELLSVDCHLETKELWDKFHELGTEMIITKTGRRMFPTVRCSFTNLHPDQKYWVLLDIVPCDNKRYRYAYHRSSWLVAGKADPPPPHRFYIHPDSPFMGDQLRKQVVSFEKVKLTNNEMDKNGQVILNSMHRFQPRIYLVVRPEGASGPVTDIEQCRYRSYIYPETIFTAVTAYQNQLITKLKIDSNPFAKGFRDSSRLNDYESDSYGLLPGLDPSFLLRSPLLSDAENNNLMAAAAEKARAFMLMSGRAGGPPPLGFFPVGGSTGQGNTPVTPTSASFVPHPGLLMGSSQNSLPQLYTLNASREAPSPLSLFSQWSSVQAAGLLSGCITTTATTTATTPSSSPNSNNNQRPSYPSLRFSPYVLPKSSSSAPSSRNSPSPPSGLSPSEEGVPSSPPSP